MNRNAQLFFKFFLSMSMGMLVFKSAYADSCENAIKEFSVQQVGARDPVVTLRAIKEKLGNPISTRTIKQEILVWDDYAAIIKDDFIVDEIVGNKESSEAFKKKEMVKNKDRAQYNADKLKQSLGEPSFSKKDILSEYEWNCPKNKSNLNAIFNSRGILLEFKSNFCFLSEKGNMWFCMGGVGWSNKNENRPIVEEIFLKNLRR
jgi:hypothetical protein